MSTASTRFHSLVSGLEYPMFIVTAAAPDGGRAGCLVGFVTQASINPPRLVVMLSKANRTYHVAVRTEILAVHFLHPGNGDLADLFGGHSGDQMDKFEYCPWDEGPGGTPLLAQTRGWVLGRIMARLDGGDHVAHLLDTIDARATDAPDNSAFRRCGTWTPGIPPDSRGRRRSTGRSGPGGPGRRAAPN